MTQTQDPRPTIAPARRRASSPVPVLIQIPAIARGTRPSSTMGRVVPRRRRRLRREFRLAGYALLLLLPVGMALSLLGGDRRPALVVSGPGHASDLDAAPLPETIAITLDPVVIPPCEAAEPPVILPGYLLPADSTEESKDGGH